MVLERKYDECLKEVKQLRAKEEMLNHKAENVRITLENSNKSLIDAITQEKDQLLSQVDNYKMLTAEMRTENSDLKVALQEATKKVD